MDPIVLTLIIASGVIFLFVLAGRLAWYVRSMAEDRGGQASRQGRHDLKAATQAGQKNIRAGDK
jgi:hypothetical protein